MAASVKAQPRSVVDVFAKLVASGEPIPNLGKVPLSQKGTTLHPDLVRHIFSFAQPNVHANFSGTCKAAYFHLKTKLTCLSISAVLGDQAKHYPIRAVVQRMIAFVKLCPNLRELDCRCLKLSKDNRASRDLIPSLMRAWPRELRSVVVPVHLSGVENDDDAAVNAFVSDVMEGIYQALPSSVENLDLRVGRPAQVREHGPLRTLQIEQVDCSNVQRLSYTDTSITTSIVFQVFTQLRHLTLALKVENQAPLISYIVQEGQNLQTLVIANGTGMRSLSLHRDIDLVPGARNPRLEHVEVVACAITDRVMRFFKGISPTLEVRFTRCRIRLNNASFGFTPKALQAYS